jgi:hypothetical protein
MVRLDGFLIDWIISFTYNCLMLGRRQSWWLPVEREYDKITRRGKAVAWID